MTTGSITRDDRSYQPGTTLLKGVRSYRQWAGGDMSARPLRPTPIYYETSTYDGRKQRFRDYSYDTRPPKRSLEYHPYSVQEYRIIDAVFFNPGTGGKFAVAGSQGSWLASNVSLLGPNDESKLINKIWESIKGSEFNAGVALGEGHEVLEMIGGNAIRLARSLRQLKTGNISGALAALLQGTSRKAKPLRSSSIKDTSINNLSSYWLELQYGWLPLLGDVKAGAEFLAHKLNVPLQTTFRASVSKRLKTQPSTPPAYYGVWKQEDVHTRRIRAVISENPSVLAQLGLLDPSVVVWELVPYSFVVDWFLPVGDWLQARAAVSHLVGTFYQSYSKERVRTQLTAGSDPNPPWLGYTLLSGSLAGSNSFISERWKETTLKVPLPAFNPLSKALSVQHALNGIALLANFR